MCQIHDVHEGDTHNVFSISSSNIHKWWIARVPSGCISSGGSSLCSFLIQHIEPGGWQPTIYVYLWNWLKKTLCVCHLHEHHGSSRHKKVVYFNVVFSSYLIICIYLLICPEVDTHNSVTKIRHSTIVLVCNSTFVDSLGWLFWWMGILLGIRKYLFDLLDTSPKGLH